MVRIPDPIIEQVRRAHDIVEVVGRVVQLRAVPSHGTLASSGATGRWNRSGKGPSFKGLCPFHAERVPSFLVWAKRQTCACFSCRVFEGAGGGDVFRFIMATQGLSFSEAVRTLAREAGIDIPEGEDA